MKLNRSRRYQASMRELLHTYMKRSTENTLVVSLLQIYKNLEKLDKLL